MAVSRYIVPISVPNIIVRFSPGSKWVLLENSRGFGSLKMINPTGRRNQRFGGGVVVCNSVLPDEIPIPSGSSPGSWKGWILGLLVTLVFPMWRSKLGPLALLKNRLDTVVQTAEDIAETVEQVAEQVDKLAEEVSEHLPAGGKLRHAVDVIEDLAEEITKKAHVLGEVIDKVQEMEDDLEELIEHPAKILAAGVDVADKATATVASPEEVVKLEEDSSKGNVNGSLSS